MTTLTEKLHKADLVGLVKKVFEIDAYKSKIGDDEDVIVLSFSVDTESAAKDLENFVEMGYNFVLDADTTVGETVDGIYKVFVELERDRHSVEHIVKLLDGISKLADLDEMRFRYFKNFTSHAATEDNLSNLVPMDKDSYRVATENYMLENFTNFFSSSYLEDIELLDESIIFKNARAEPIRFEIIRSGHKQDIYESTTGPILIDAKTMSEIMFLTKYIGNYNITKIGNRYIFENRDYAILLERIP